MRQLLSILSLVLLVSCNGNYDYVESDVIKGTGEKDPELFIYLERFEKDMDVTIPSHLSINVVDKLYNIDSSSVDAVCWSDRASGRGEKIEIKRSRWNELDEEGREQLLYHELGHCVLNKDHHRGYEDGSTGRWCPTSIMNPYTFTELQIEECYIPDHEDYLIELRR